MKVVEIDNYSDFLALEERWNDVLQRCDHTIFSTWEWLSTWWKYFGNDRKLVLLLTEENNEIIGIAPLMYSVYRMFGLRMGKIEFIGTPHSDYNDFILAEKGDECIKLFIEYILNNLSEKWDRIELKEIPETSKSLVHLNRTEGNIKLQKRALHECPYLSLARSFNVFFHGLNSKFRKELQRRMRRLQEKYRVEFKDYSKPEFFTEGMRLMFYLHQKRWRTLGGVGFFGDQKICSFHLDIARLFSARKWLSLFLLLADNKAIASQYGFRYKSKSCDYLTGLDPAYQKYSAGNLLCLLATENYIDEGMTEYDFLRGKELYKLRWNPSIRKNFEVVLTKPGFLSLINDKLVREYWHQGNRLKYLLKIQ